MANAKTIEFILKAISDFGDVKGNIDTIQKSLNQLKLNPQLKQNFSNIFADLQKQTAKYQDYLNSGFKTKGDVTGLEKTGNKINALLNQLQTNMNKIDPSVLKESFEIDTTQFEELNKQLKETQNNINQITSSDKFKSLTGQVDGVVSKLNTLSKSKAISQFQESFKTGNIEQTKIALDKLIENANKFNDEGKKTEYLDYIDKLKTAFDRLSKIDGLQKANDDLKDFSSQLESLGAKQLEELLNAFAQGKIDVQNFVNAVRGYSSATSEAAKKTFEFGSEIDHFKNRAAYFLGLTNSINLFKRALQKALETVKELDAVMTETAVVTDFTVGDMWEKLPEYAAHAKTLGSSIKDVYAATTLYYQQGLKTNEAMGVGVETMKMARIANLEAGDATQYMTAALRGFNMEVNELNAQRVNDVYSELAAITAADTSQIATAMSKTASIASAANMEFETTAALLAQIIETTQEAPETAGTALKTIIARFSEVKKLREEGQMTGKDEEGEEIDVNKIQAALRTVNISMNDFFAGTEGLDSILLKLAEKWGSLDFETQRYIATMAAGSRQQSRFIAMMSDYERTMELATAANNSAGASQQQFDKTLDSMEAKLAKLTTAWQEFTMGLANNELLKGAVDAFTFVLNAINKLIDVLSGNNGIAKSVITLNLAIAAIGGLRAALKKLFGSSLIGTVQKAFKSIEIQSKNTGLTAGENIAAGLEKELNEFADNSGVIGTKLGQNIASSANAAISAELNKTSQQTEAPQINNGSATKVPVVKKGSGERVKSKPAAQTNQPQPTSIPSTPDIEQSTKVQSAWSKAMADTSAKGFILTGVLTSLTGTALNWAGTAASSKNETNAFGAGLKAAGGAASIAGNSLSLLAPILTTLEVSIGSILPYVAAAVAAVGVIIGVVQAIKNASPEGQLKAAQKAADGLKEAANNATQAYNNLVDSMDALEDKYTTLEELTRGSREWRDAVQEINSEVLDLIDKYPELATLLETKDGVLSINKEKTDSKGQTYDDIVENYNKAITNNQASQTYAEAAVIKAQTKVDYQDYRVKAGRYSEQILEQGQYINYAKTDESGQPKIETFKAEEITNSLAMAIASGDIDFSFDNDRANIVSFTEHLQSAFGLSAQAAESLAYELSNESEQLYKWGTQLIGSQEQIDGYNKMLISQVGESSGLQKEERAMAENYMTADMIAEEIDPKYREVLKGGISEKEKELFAQQSGYRYEDSKFFDASGAEVEGVTDEVIATGIATANSMDNLTNKMIAFAGAIGKTNLKNLYKKEDGQGLTSKDFAEAKLEKNQETGQFEATEEQLTDIAKAKYDETDENGQLTEQAMALREMYASGEEFAKVYADSMMMGIETYNKAISDLAAFGVQDLFSNIEIDSSSLGGIVDNLYDVFLKSGPEAAKGLASSIEATLNTIEDPEQAQIFADALNTIDWQNLNDVEELETILTGMDFDYAIDGLDELKQEIITAAKATKTFNLDAIKEQVKSIEGLVEDIEDREDTERKFTQEEYDAITKANPELASQFVATGLDEFVYVGDSMQSLIEALNQNTAALIGDYGEQVRNNAVMSEKWLGLEGQRFNSEYSAMELITSVIGGSIDASLYDVRDDGTRSQGAMDLINLMEQLGLGAESGRDLNSSVYSGEDLVRILTEGYNQYYGDFGAIAQQNVDNAAAYTQKEETIRLSKMEGTEILNDSQATEENKQAALDAKVALEGLQEEYDKTAKSLKAQNSALASNEKLIKASVVDAKNYEDKLADLAEAYDDNKDALKDTNKGTREYQQALTNVTKAAKEAFGNDITEDFVEENLDLFEDWYKGAEGSADKLREALTNSLIETLDDTAINVDSVKNIIAGLDGLDFDIYGHADASQLFEELTKVMGSAAEAARAMEVLGYSVTWEETGSKRMQIFDPESPTGKRMVDVPQYKAVVTDGLGNRAGANKSSYGGGKGGGGGGGGGGGSKTKWENPYDEFYNTVEKINEELRTREKLERRYQNLLNKTGTKASDLVKNAQKQLESLQAEKKLHEELLNGRKRQMSDVENENKDLQKYARYNEELGVIEIDWEKINALDGSKNEKLTSRIEDYIKELEERQSQIEEEEDALADIEEAVWEIYDQGKDEYFDLEQKIKNALVNQRQQEIDKLSAINDSINDTNGRLIDAMRSSIDKYRQDRENERTEEELSDKQRRLAYLQQDTSGANALEIMQLQEEIDQGMEDYTDQLIDQKINELQEQNDKAAEQREKQIAIAEAQLKKWEESGEIWNNVYELMSSGIDENGIVIGSDLYQLLAQNEDYPSMSNLEKLKWAEELVDQVAQAVQWLAVGNSTEALIKKGELSKGQQITFTTKNGDEVTGTLQDNGDVIDSQGNTYTGVYRDQEGNWVTEEETKKVENEGGTSTGGTGNEEDTSNQQQTKYPYGKASEVSGEVKYGDKGKKVKAIQWALKKLGYSIGSSGVDGIFGNDTLKAVKKFQRNSKISADGIVGKNTKKAFKLKQYASGGLADFTGPAWLDGTKSKPEYILSADQTKAFFKLVDILSGLRSGANQSSQITGDSIYDVDINVESIGSDYDVEKLATTIKRMINDDARYRNNNAINLQR